LRADRVARVGQALVDIALTPRPHVAWQAPALVAADLLYTSAAVMTWVADTVVDVLLTQQALRAMRTRTPETIDEIVTSATVLTWSLLTFVYVVFTVHALIALCTCALISSYQVMASSPIPTWCRVTFIYVVLAVGASESLCTMAAVEVAYVMARSSILAQVVQHHTFLYSGGLAGDLPHVAHGARPAGATLTLVPGALLDTTRTISTWVLQAPVNRRITSCSGESVRAVTLVSTAIDVAARCRIETR
jgi:hypothetical protein